MNNKNVACWQQMAKMASGGMGGGTAVRAVSKRIRNSHASSDHDQVGRYDERGRWGKTEVILRQIWPS